MLDNPLNDTEYRMANALPARWAPGATIRWLLRVAAQEIDNLRQTIIGLPDQGYARRSTYGLPILESEFGLPTDASLDVAQRQDRLVAKERILGPADLYGIKATAEAFVYGTVNVIPDFAKYTIVVQFIDSRGLPSNLTDLQSAVRARVPTALDLNYWYRYTTYGEYKTWKFTYGDLKAMGLTYGQMKTWAPTGNQAPPQSGSAATTGASQASGGT